ncbi:hypothetical protein [Streptococcus parasanguinis]|uniref:hypothetical protein n=1 Tax=Streptococcus parasanguinis TaxID=1318 RepID=UPI000C7E00F6|nr:hypothetical protein [Streptococcus parasanguinis]PKZ95925.1 hypothetical protein CYK20_10700 [Streptococcus parasanguinis]
MNEYTTLTEFVKKQMTKFGIEENEKNFSKLRIKCTRALKDLDIWDQAETKLIGKKYTKVFSRQQLISLYNEVESYLLRHSNIDIEKLEAHRREHSQYMDDLFSGRFDKYHSDSYEAPKVSAQEKMEVMITALFEKFFEPLDLKTWNDDKATTFYLGPEDADNIDYFLASERLNNPLQSYTQPKQ